MNTPRISLAALFIALPFAVGATPTLKITSPTKSSTTNGVINASGTATGVAPVTVYYSFNASAWATASGTTNWTVPGLALTPGSNTFSAYVTDASAAVSKTNIVKFFYVVDVPVTVLTNGNGVISPNYNGKSLEIGKKYMMDAKGSKGFGFISWSLNGGPLTNAARISFIMESNLTFTANFKDTARPLCVITFPSVNHSVSNSPINVTGRASDNVGVTGVNYQLNGGGWNAATLDDPTNWEADNLSLSVGANTIQAFAVDAAGNVSLTNTVNFNYVSNAPPPPVGPAPASIADTVAAVNPDSGAGLFQVCFGLSTDAQTSTNGEEDSQVGNYTYTLLSSNTAQLNFTTVLPPQDNGGGGQVTLTFTDNSDATYIDTNGNSGSITFSAASNSAPSPSAIITAQSVDLLGNTNTITLNGGSFTNTDGQTYTNWGAYTLTPFSPLDLELTENFTDPTDDSNVAFVQLDFSAASTGDFFVSEFDNMNNLLGTDSGGFTVLNTANPPAGNAPDSLDGLIWSASPTSGPSFQLCFGADTYSRSSSNTNKNDVGVYSYVKTGPNTAQFQDFETEPQRGGFGGNGGNGSSVIDLTFTSSTKATVLQDGSNVGTITESAAKNLAPTSVAGKTITGSSGSEIVLNTDGTFTQFKNSTFFNSGVYTYAQFSSIGGMVVVDITAGSDSGNTSYAELTFTSLSGGNLFISAFDSLGNLQDAHGGTFTIK